MLRIRLRRTGAKKQPRYRVVVAEARTRRDGAFVENLGYYDPLTEPATVHIDTEKAQSWIAKGAQPSDTVVRLLRNVGLDVRAAATAAATQSATESEGTERPRATTSEPASE